MRYAAFLSGGGFTGAYQAGAIQRLHQEGIKPSVVYGISVGSLNGAMWAMREVDRLVEFWKRIGFKDVFSGNPYWNALTSTGLYSNKPLWRLIQQEVDPDRMEAEFYAGAVNFETMKYQTFSNRRDSKEVLLKGILASTAMPVYHRLVEINDDLWADGGVWQVTPVGHFLDLSRERVDELIIINCQPPEPEHVPTPLISLGPLGIGKVGNVLKTTLGLLIEKSIWADMKMFEIVNYLTLKAGPIVRKSGEGLYEHFPALIIHPAHSLGSGMDADRSKLDALFEQGLADAGVALEAWRADRRRDPRISSMVAGTGGRSRSAAAQPAADVNDA